MKLFLFILLVFASKNEYGANKIPNVVVKIEEDEIVNVNKGYSSQYVGVSWDKSKIKWRVSRISKLDGKAVHNGYFNVDEETKAAHASDTLARKFIKNGEKGHKLNFPNDETEVQAEKREKLSKYFGVTWDKGHSKWRVQRRSKLDGKNVHNGLFNVDEEIKAAHASDTLARQLMEKGTEGHKLNFPNDETKVWAEKKETSSKYFGVSWSKSKSKWRVRRRSKLEEKMVHNGYFKVEEESKAAHASDKLARKLMRNGEKGHKLNFSEDEIEVRVEKNNKRKRTGDSKPQIDWN